MDAKPWYKSLGEWSALAMPLIALILPMFGQVELGKFVTEESAGLTEWFTALGIVIASALAFYGRWRATTKITT